MDAYSIILDSIVGFLFGVLLILLYYYLRIVRSSPKEQTSSESNIPKFPAFNTQALVKLYENWIIEDSELGKGEIVLLGALGFIKELVGNLAVADAPKLRKFLLDIARILSEETPPLVELDQKSLFRLANLGIKSITFIRVSSEVGPEFLYTTTPTRLTRRLSRDLELLKNLFFMVSRVEEAKVEGSRIIIKEVEGGERGIEGFLICEIARTADVEDIKRRVLDKINEIPSDPERAKNILKMVL